MIKRSPFTQGKSKKPKSEAKRLREKAWELMSLVVRQRDRKCVTCDKRLPIKKLQAGHFLHSCLDFDLRNINAQCEHCNYFLNGNLSEYRAYLEKKYGPDIVAKLKIAKKLEKKLYSWELELIICDLQKTLKGE